jgi:hypothetical protein
MSGLSTFLKGALKGAEEAAPTATGGLKKALTDLRAPLMTPAFKVKHLGPEIEARVMRVGAGRDVATARAEDIFHKIAGHLSPDKLDLAGRIPLHARYEALKAKGIPEDQIRIPRLTPDELKHVNQDAELQQFITDYKQHFQKHLEEANRKLGITKFEDESPFHQLFVNLRAVDEDFSGHTVRPMYWDSTTGKNLEIASKDGVPQIPKGGYRGPAATEHQRMLKAHGATGGADAYETDLRAQIHHLVNSRWPAVEKANLIEAAERQGIAIPWNPATMGQAPRTFKFKVPQRDPYGDQILDEAGNPVLEEQEMPAVLKEWDAKSLHYDQMKDEDEYKISPFALQRTQMKHLVPQDFAEALNQVEQDVTPKPGTPADWWQKAQNLATTVHLSFSPTATIRHSLRGLSILKSIPAAPGDWGGFALQTAGGPVGGYLNTLRELPKRANSEEGRRVFEDVLIPLGGARVNSFEGALETDRKFKGPFHMGEQFLFGHPYRPPANAPEFLKNYWGLDSRLRTTTALLYKSWKETPGKNGVIRKVTDAELADFARQFGNYIAPLQQGWLRTARKAGVTFGAFEANAIPTEMARALGNHGMDVSHLPIVKQRMLNALTMWNGILGSVVASSFLTKVFAGYFPWEKKGKGIGYGDIVVSSQDGKERTIPMTDFNPAMARAMKLLGLKDLMAGKGGNIPYTWLNEALSLPGPGLQDAVVASTGRELHLLPNGELQKVAPDMATPEQQLKENVLSRGMAVAGPIPQAGLDIARMMKGGLPPGGLAEGGNKWLNMALRGAQAMTGEAIYQTPPHGDGVTTEKDRRAGNQMAIKHAEEEALAAASEGDMDSARARLQEVINSTPGPYKKAAYGAFVRTFKSRWRLMQTQ